MNRVTPSLPNSANQNQDDETDIYQFGKAECITANAKLRLVGVAHLTLKSDSRKINAGSVVETGMGALLLWLHIYPMGGQDVKITFTQDQGWGTNDVGVLLDHTQHIAEFTIGSVIFAGNTASVSMFGIPTLPASLLLKTPEFDCLEWRGDI